MFGLPPSVEIYFATGLVDMRNGIDGLRAVVENTPRKNPDEGHLFVFVGRTRDKLNRNGYVVYFKRFERGRFQLPVLDTTRTRVEMEPGQLAMLLDGIDLNAKRLVRWKPETLGIDTYTPT